MGKTSNDAITGDSHGAVVHDRWERPLHKPCAIKSIQATQKNISDHFGPAYWNSTQHVAWIPLIKESVNYRSEIASTIEKQSVGNDQPKLS